MAARLPSNDFIRNQNASKNNDGYSTSCADQEGNGPFDRFKDRRPFGYVKLLVDQVHPLLFCTVDEFIDDRFTAVFGTKFHRPFQGYIYIIYISILCICIYIYVYVHTLDMVDWEGCGRISTRI